jgi:hypothetical protein
MSTSTAETTDDNLSRQLREWTQTSLTDLYNVDKDPQAQTLFTPDAQITINGDVLSPEKYNEHITGQRASGVVTRIDIVWGDVLVTPEHESVCHRLSSITAATLTRAWNSAPYYSKDLTPLPAH